MLDRYRTDCEYFLGNGNGYEGHLYFKSVEEHCDEMEKLWNSFADDEKPEWLPQIQYDKVLLGKLKSNYFNAKALYETIKANAEEIQRKVLVENEFYETEDVAEMMKKRGGDGKPKRILDPDLTYMMDLDNELPRFIDLCYPEYVKAGIADSRGKDYIPEANAKDLMYEAEKQLVEYGIDIIPDEFGEKETLRKAVQMIKYRDKVLDLVLRLESGKVENYAENINGNAD